MTTSPWNPDPALDLVLEREIAAPPATVWKAWTQPEHLSKWFAPAPWTITRCEIDLRPGGALQFEMRSPEGDSQPGTGCYLEVTPNERLVWTDALGPGYRPSAEPFMTAVITLTPSGAGTRCTAVAIHRDETVRAQHEEMGFFEGWGTTFDQLAALAESM